MPKSKLNGHYRHKVETELSMAEFESFTILCSQRKGSESALAREAIVSYLNYIEETREKKWEREAAQNINQTTDRICAMLSKQGMQMGTLLELTRHNLIAFNQEQKYESAVQFSVKNLLDSLERRLGKANSSCTRSNHS